MAGLPPLRRLRKTALILIVVFVGFVAHRLVSYLLDSSTIRDADNTELSLAQGVVCRHIVKETPFGTDSIFEEGLRLYFYTSISHSLQNRSDSLLHVWYYGMDTVQVSPCVLKKDGEACYTDILPAILKPGEWSVDLVAGRTLLSSKQFVIEPISR